MKLVIRLLYEMKFIKTFPGDLQSAQNMAKSAQTLGTLQHFIINCD